MNLKFILVIYKILAISLVDSASLFYDEEIKTSPIDLNNPTHQTMLINNFNLSAEEILQIRKVSEQMKKNATTNVDDENDPFMFQKHDRKEDIFNKISDLREKMPPPEELTHEMAAYPSCNQNNESQWMNENNVTVKFSTTIFERNEKHLYLDTAVLRLFKLNPNRSNSSRTTRSADLSACDDSPMDSQIRVTVSTIQTHRRNKKDKKKRICNTKMLNVSDEGWIEIDVKRAINIWEKYERQQQQSNGNNNLNDSKPVMMGWLTIEVHDEEERPLKPGLYFEPPKCSQAYPALPWNAYRIYYNTQAIMEKVPKSPRLDVKLVDLRGINEMLKKTRPAFNYNPFINFGRHSSSHFSEITTDCVNNNHTHHQDSEQQDSDASHHTHQNELNHHKKHHFNPEQTIYYTDEKLNSTANRRIEEIRIATIGALSPRPPSAGHFENPFLTKRHMKRHIISAESAEISQQHHSQHQQHHHNIRKRKINNGNIHHHSKRHHNLNKRSSFSQNDNDNKEKTSSILVRKIKKLTQ